MKQHYVITESGGEYDDAWEQVVCTTDDKVKGEAYVKERTEFCVAVGVAQDEIDAHMNKWRAENPAPSITAEPAHVVPRWLNNITITIEMRMERIRLEKLNAEAAIIKCSPLRVWMDLYKAEQAAIQSAFSDEIINGVRHSVNDHSWNIEPVKWL